LARGLDFLRFEARQDELSMALAGQSRWLTAGGAGCAMGWRDHRPGLAAEVGPLGAPVHPGAQCGDFRSDSRGPTGGMTLPSAALVRAMRLLLALSPATITSYGRLAVVEAQAFHLRLRSVHT